MHQGLSISGYRRRGLADGERRVGLHPRCVVFHARLKSCQHTGRGPRPGQLSVRAAGTVQTRNRTRQLGQVKEHTGFLVGRSPTLPSAPPWAGGVIRCFSFTPKKGVVNYINCVTLLLFQFSKRVTVPEYVQYLLRGFKMLMYKLKYFAVYHINRLQRTIKYTWATFKIKKCTSEKEVLYFFQVRVILLKYILTCIYYEYCKYTVYLQYS